MNDYQVLVVEDNPMNMQLVTDVLSASGLTVFAANSAEEAFEIARTVWVDLILMDIALPGIDGLEAIRQLKADSRTSFIPIVAITAHAMRGDKQRILDVGSSGYIAKPIDTRTFADQVLAFLSGPASTKPEDEV